MKKPKFEIGQTVYNAVSKRVVTSNQLVSLTQH